MASLWGGGNFKRRADAGAIHSNLSCSLRDSLGACRPRVPHRKVTQIPPLRGDTYTMRAATVPRIRTSRPASSLNSRLRAISRVSPGSTIPPGRSHMPAYCNDRTDLRRRRILPLETTIAFTPTTTRSRRLISGRGGAHASKEMWATSEIDSFYSLRRPKSQVCRDGALV